MSILESEMRLRCLEMALVIAGRRMEHDPKAMIDIADELCQYAAIGSSPTDKKGSGEAKASAGTSKK